MERDAGPTDTPERMAGLKARLRQKASQVADPIVREQYRNLFDERTAPKARRPGLRSRRDGTGVWAAATEDMNLADAMRRCLRIGADDMEGARGGDARSSPGSLMLRQCPHRFAVIDAGGMVTDVVAQSDVAMYLRRNRELLDPSVLDAPVKSLGLGAQGGRRVVSLSVSVPVIDCFYEMERSSVQAVAIVDDGTDVLVGNLSESDIVALRPDAFGAFAQLVGFSLVVRWVNAPARQGA